ncbi:M23 family metallopeptidase [Hyphomonas sp. FCG-A18]|uniref:peptidoglycan DD-metalloendopeptidase family protein n=1 Tax=Hyphomonas sp. FCG-A18 TaxID=3080019 RepID=UPI002B2C1DDA|nr:M23 family metallopeptidase [Hyphomonas sp. FCG-A18]
MKLPRSFPIPRSRGMRSLTVLVGAFALFGGIALSLRPAVKTAEPVIADLQPRAPLLAELPSEFETDFALSPTVTRLQRRETLSGLTDRLGLDRRDAALALASLTDAELLDPRRVRAGLEVTVWQDNDQLTALKVTPETGRQMIAKRGHDDVWRSFELKAREVAMPIVVRGTVQTSLYVDALEQGAGDQQVVDFAQVFAYDVDFQREVHPGDEFEFVYEAVSDERGNPIRAGNLIYAALNGRAVDKSFYRFTPEDTGETDYFQGNGESATRFLMKTPINGARLSSRFGNRRHPISGYTRLHKGTDFAAPTGTPIYAAGHGTVERASRYGGYGHYVRIRHANGYKTAYAHMSRYGRGVRKGTRVRQGQVIGYVGSTGASTGPHLHYEVYINGKPVDAMRLKLPTGRKLAGEPEIMAAFEVERDRIDAIRNTSHEDGDDLLIAAAIPGN